MHMGIVVGRVTATRKDENLVGTKLLITQPIGLDGQVLPNPIITVDTVGAGIGERVIYVTGSMASRAIRNKDAPVDAAIIGIIDSLEGTMTGG
ncbi:EutN/CcmL family microcompartment protein [Bacillus sp. DTU_2020_1000418_1_SI_GHA_SEK_038]|uniref:EutN/CcmL family microcompartment protein n=1 Tax=Bacillus sp. DTU_2020_1000418_1_SI_GHA_SEK_038 TaxID=3077585 RepID=UPI0028E431F9|nr:EutN/CcmL family microcompartment protein [Bacillus sp. DTU_2020_1000418_1_SI_GHA_SEK_038]WNS77406.1 EutN/CcmL family microcompartment protein [Bacillus sp. DTU_2020_1000418_1_SI_GHA_SEK_038]